MLDFNNFAVLFKYSIINRLYIKIYLLYIITANRGQSPDDADMNAYYAEEIILSKKR